MNAIHNNEKLASHVDNRPLQESHLVFREARHLKEIKIIAIGVSSQRGQAVNQLSDHLVAH
jgi:hypothetical protein